MTATQFKALVTALQDIVSVLSEADPETKAQGYVDLGVTWSTPPTGWWPSRARSTQR